MANQYRDRPFPADDDYSRDQSRIAPQQGESDPLAELARLIGQADPFSNFGREQQAQPARHDPRDQYAAHEPVAEEEDVPAVRPSWVQNLASARHAPQEPAYREEPYREEHYRAEDRYDPPHADEQRYPAQDDIYGRHAPQFDHSGYDPVLTGQGRGQQAAASDRYDDVLYGRPDRDPGHDGDFGAQGGQYDDGYDRPPYGEDFEQDSPKARRGGTMTVVVVLLLAVIGTGAAFAYRTFVGSPRSGEPPVIKADAGPNKVIPPGAGDSSGKITDRVGDKSAERVVSREEQPVDVNAKAGPRVVFPPLTQNANPPTVASASPNARPTGAGVGNGTLTGGEEPRKIRTLSIRPDQPDAAAAAPPATPARAQPPAQRASTTAPASTASTGVPAANAPVSLSPQAPPVAAPAERPKVAAISPAAVTGGGAYVQVSSQKSEADAKASFRSLQGKYASILGSRTASIHKADIAGKGTFYRAMVGPFGTNEEATTFCGNLKSAGGQCVVQRR